MRLRRAVAHMLARVGPMRYGHAMHKATHGGPELVTTAEAAKTLGVHVATISRMVAAGRLTPAIKVPGKTGAYLFHRTDVERLTAA